MENGRHKKTTSFLHRIFNKFFKCKSSEIPVQMTKSDFQLNKFGLTVGNCLCYKFMHNITITYQHTQRLSYAADRMGQSLVQIFQSPVYMRLNWSDTNGTWAEMSLYHTPTIYRSKAVPIFVHSSDMIPVLGDEKKRKKLVSHWKATSSYP